MLSDEPNEIPRLAVVTVSYGSEGVLPAFLDSVDRATDASVDVGVVDNKPSEGSPVVELCAERGIRYLPLPANPGYGGAVNAGVRALGPDVEWILISNPDVVLEPQAIDRLHAVGEADERIAAVGPAIINADGSVYPSARAVPSVGHGIGHALFANIWPGNPWTRTYHRSETGSTAGPTGWLSGACLLVRRRAFDEIGGFDESFFMYFEDVDLGFRLGRSGFLNVYAPEARVHHAGAHSTAVDPVPMLDAHHRSARRFLSKRYPGLRYLPLRAAIGAGLRFRAVVAAARSRSARQGA